MAVVGAFGGGWSMWWVVGACGGRERGGDSWGSHVEIEWCV